MSGPEDLVLLVPQGAEYKAVMRGAVPQGAVLRGARPKGGQRAADAMPIVPIAVGQAAIASLKSLGASPPARAILLGLGGSLSPTQGPGDVVVYRDCIEQASGKRLACDRALTATLVKTLKSGGRGVEGSEVTGLTSERVIYSAVEKRRLGVRHSAAAVDMEGYVALNLLQKRGVSVGIVRVVSDGVDGDIPDLSGAIAGDGALRPLELALAMGRSPRSALRLVRGSLRGLSVLQRVAAQLQDFGRC